MFARFASSFGCVKDGRPEGTTWLVWRMLGNVAQFVAFCATVDRFAAIVIFIRSLLVCIIDDSENISENISSDLSKQIVEKEF